MASEHGSEGTATRRRGWRRWLRRVLGYGGLVLAAVATFAVVDGWVAFGKGASGERLRRMEQSPQWDGDGFENPQPLYNDAWLTIRAMVSGSSEASPDVELPVVAGDAERFAQPPASGLRVTWLGHSTMLLEIDGHRVLTDPVWGERSSPLGWIGPKRWYPPPLALDALPSFDAVIISHDHYDHLDQPTIDRIKGWDTTFVVPLGVAAHLEYWGVPTDRIVELDWWERQDLAGLTITCTPARHASGRTLFDKDDTLWAGYAVVGPQHRVFFSGDTGLFPAMAEIGSTLGPFDLTMIEVGAYGQGWPDWHLGPEQAVLAHQLLQGRAMLPVHWGLFDLAFHGWTEPIERVLVSAVPLGVDVLTPRPGESIEPERPHDRERWWPQVPWQTAAEDPIVATRMDGGA